MTDIGSDGQKTTNSLNGKLTFEQDKNRIVGRDEENFIRMLILADGNDFVMKVAPPGMNATTADNEDLIFNSSQNVLKVVQSGTLSLTQATIADPGAGNYASDTGTLGTVNHNLGYVPAFLAYVESATGVRTSLPFTFQDTISSTQARWNSYYASATTTQFFVGYRRVVIGTSSATFAPPVEVKYFLLQESAA